MSVNLAKEPFLFSAGTLLAYKIAKRYYQNIHYVWCTVEFNSKCQPITSNPFTICKRLLEQITTGDRHSIEIKNNKAGILIGAKAKLDAGIISVDQYDEINQLVSCADYEAFSPVLYIINSRNVENKCEEITLCDKASNDSIEYKIEELKGDEFQIINFKDLLNGIITIADKKAGD